MQHYDAWGKKLAGDVGQTKRGFTGQYLDDTGLLYYNARYYDPNIGRFVSADALVPGNASGGTSGIALKPLLVTAHETSFNARIAQENNLGPWLTLSNKQKQQLGDPMGPMNPQALNRYSYTLNNPVRYVDPSGHFGVTIYGTGNFTIHLTHDEATLLWTAITSKDATLIAAALDLLGAAAQAGGVGSGCSSFGISRRINWCWDSYGISTNRNG